MSATSVASDERRYLLKLRGYRQKPNAAMKKGTEAHKKRQEGIPTVTDMGIKRFQKNVLLGKHVQVSEAMVCSPKYGLKGFVDILDVEYTKEGKFKITVTELKTGAWYKHYIYQVISYGLMFSDPNCQIHYDKKGRKKIKHIPTRLYPMGELDLDIDIILEFMPSGKELHYPFMTGGLVSGTMAGLASATLQRKKKRLRFHNTGLYYLEDTPPCEGCKQDDKFCSLWGPVCSKIHYTEAIKTKQMYYGKKKMLVKSRPKGVIKPK